MYSPDCKLCSLCLFQKHWNENKWNLGDCWTKLLTDKDVTCVGHTVKADFTRVLNTFFPENHQEFKPRYVDVVKMWELCDKQSFKKSRKKTLDHMMLRLHWVLRKPKQIRQGVWRTMNVLDRPQLEYAVLDALSTLVLYKHYSGACIGDMCMVHTLPLL